MKAARTFTGSSAYFPDSIVVSDINGDGKPDVVIGGGYCTGSGNVTALLGNGNGTFQVQRTILFGGAYAPIFPSIVDLNGDRKPDLIIADRSSGGSYLADVILGNGNGTFHALHTFPGQSDGSAGDRRGQARH